MTHPEDGPSDFLEDEKKKDPIELAREIFIEMKEERERARACAPGVGAYVPKPTSLPITMQVIENGILIHHHTDHYGGVAVPGHFGGIAPGSTGFKTVYAPDQAGAEAIVLRILREFLLSALGTPGLEAGKTPPEASTGSGPLLGPPTGIPPYGEPLEP